MRVCDELPVPAAEKFPQLTFRTFVISLERAVERRAHIHALMKRLGIDAEIVDAVDGRRLTTQHLARYDAKAAMQVYGCDLSPNEIACFNSHLGILERMIAEGVKTALIFEDDIDCDVDIAAAAAQLCALPDGAWSLVRLETLKPILANPRQRRAIGKRIAMIGSRRLDRVATGVLGAGAYLVRRRAAEAILRHSQRFFMPYDQMLDRYWENGIAPTLLRPAPARQLEAFESVIGERGLAVQRMSLSTRLWRRWRRAADSFNKRMFWVALMAPPAGRVLAAMGVKSADVALNSPAVARLKSETEIEADNRLATNQARSVEN
ncbi:MAG TPA: glycosyltransferase family 25 protein [Hyphomonadaceae bacterium]|nr:glycosyltransferase family 25 protein [Hyphomonadaceae bacterium]